VTWVTVPHLVTGDWSLLPAFDPSSLRGLALLVAAVVPVAAIAVRGLRVAPGRSVQRDASPG
jgi:hypothetical protein